MIFDPFNPHLSSRAYPQISTAQQAITQALKGKQQVPPEITQTIMGQGGLGGGSFGAPAASRVGQAAGAIGGLFGGGGQRPPQTTTLNPGGQAMPATANPQAPWNFQGPGLQPGGQARPPQAQAPGNHPRAGFTGWGQYANQMTGFDLPRYQRDIIGNPQHPEYAAKKITVAELASQIDPRDPQAVQKLVEMLKARGEQVEFDGLDRIRFADAPQDGWIDVLRNKTFLQGGADNRAWAWQDNHGKGPGGGGGMGGAISAALGGGNPAFARGFAGNAPFAASQWLQQLLAGLGVKI